MPRVSKIAPGQRRNWLDRYDGGEPIENIAKDAKRDIRTVREHIEKARLELDFEAAQRDQLRGALQSHQQDLMALLVHLRDAVHVPKLVFNDSVGVDFGLEDLWEPSDFARNQEVGFGSLLPISGHAQGQDRPKYALGYESQPAIRVTRNINGPQEIELTVEGSRLWRALKEHIGKDPLWRHITDWRKSFLEELQRRATLNRTIRTKTEEIFGLTVGRTPGSHTPWLSPRMVWWMRARLTDLALGDCVPDVDSDIRKVIPTGGLEARSGLLADALEDTEIAMGHLQNTIAAMTDSGEVRAAAQSYGNLQGRTSRVHSALDEYLLIHLIPGRCGLCRKLGGQ